MKKVVSVSVEESVLKSGREAAHEMRVSFSSFVEGAILSKVNVSKFQKSVVSDLNGKPLIEVLEGEETLTSENLDKAVKEFDLEAANEKLKEKQRDIKAEKIAKVRDNIRPDIEVVGEIANQLGQVKKPMPKGGKK